MYLAETILPGSLIILAARVLVFQALDREPDAPSTRTIALMRVAACRVCLRKGRARRRFVLAVADDFSSARLSVYVGRVLLSEAVAQDAESALTLRADMNRDVAALQRDGWQIDWYGRP